jgi:hypothetical protein
VTDIQVSVVGYVGCDVQFRTSRNGTDVASFRVASTPRYFDQAKGRWTDGQTTWLTVVCYRAARPTRVFLGTEGGSDHRGGQASDAGLDPTRRHAGAA